jgi:hypothetical protein
MVWTRNYENTRDLWHEGNFLRIEGKVKVKEERMQITCDAAEQCKQEVQSKAATLVASTLPSKNNGNGKNGNGKNGKMVGANGTTTNGKNDKTQAAPVELHKLTIVIYETDDEEKDIAYLDKIMEILKDARGKDEVCLRIINHERITNLKMNNTYVDYSPDLQKRLSKLVAPENIIVETIDNIQ